MRGLDDLVRQGKILYAGVSDFPAWVVALANTLADPRGWWHFAAMISRMTTLSGWTARAPLHH